MDLEDSELDLRLYPDSDDESCEEPPGEAVEGAEGSCLIVVSRVVLLFGSGLLCGTGVPKLVNWLPSRGKSSDRKMPSLFAARLVSKNSKSGS